uniref:Uncharacterized protein n=1 Tax=Lactuca sativa TaxID=4236 RepID=A0A9R1WCI2_LACSA|nr:hypothetical protein LSAT_V11C200095760 [Lactuca sativa]
MYLNVKSNQIQGLFPPSIRNMRNLYALDMSYNRLNGGMPQCFSNIISYVKVINIEKNHFHGTVPNVYEHCGILEGLVLNENQLLGEVLSSLSKCQNVNTRRHHLLTKDRECVLREALSTDEGLFMVVEETLKAFGQ